MGGFTTAFPNSLKGELPQAIQDFSLGGDQFKVALGIAAPAGTYDNDTFNYSQLVAASDELPNGSGYTTGGFAFTAAQNITPITDNITNIAYWQWSVNPQWTSLTANTLGCIIYNNSKTGRVVYIGNFGSVQSVIGSTLTLILPVNAPATALLSLI